MGKTVIVLFISMFITFIGAFAQPSLDIPDEISLIQPGAPDLEFAPPFDKSQTDWYRDWIVDRDSYNQAAPGTEVPYIYMAGYMDTEITYLYGGTLTMLAYVVDMDSAVDRVEIFYAGMPTGVYLYDDGNHADYGANDGLWGFRVVVPAQSVPVGEYLLELRAFDTDNNVSDLWPYLTIHS
jgi:hypothetical protein